MVFQKIPGSDTAMYYDDMVFMVVGNYDAANAVLKLVESVMVCEYIRVFHGETWAK